MKKIKRRKILKIVGLTYAAIVIFFTLVYVIGTYAGVFNVPVKEEVAQTYVLNTREVKITEPVYDKERKTITMYISCEEVLSMEEVHTFASGQMAPGFVVFDDVVPGETYYFELAPYWDWAGENVIFEFEYTVPLD